MDFKHRLNSIRDRFKLTSIIISIIILLIVVVLFVNSNIGIHSFEIEDKCGKFMNLIQHTINTETDCKTRCISKCTSSDYVLKKIEFELGTTSCNKCMCYCRE